MKKNKGKYFGFVLCIVALLCFIAGGWKLIRHEKWQSSTLHSLESKVNKEKIVLEEILQEESQINKLLEEESQTNKSQEEIINDLESINYTKEQITALNNLLQENSLTVYDRALFSNGIIIASKCGEGLGCPPNSSISVLEAFKQGYDAFRINVCKTLDGEYVLSHDAAINSTARNIDGTEIEGEIFIAEHTLRELNKYDYGIKYGNEYSGLGITTLEQCVALTSKLGMRLDIEWKNPDSSKEDFEEIYRIIVSNGYSNNNWHWIAYNKEMVDWFKSICDYVDIECLINEKSPNWDFIEYAKSRNHEVIVGYWKSSMPIDNTIEMRKRNVVQNRGTARNVEEMVRDIECGVTELECSFSYPRQALIDYVIKEVEKAYKNE